MTFGDEIRKRGFLADEINVYKDQYHRVHREIFSNSQRYSDKATRLLFEADLDGILNHQLMALSFWQRSIRSCQAVILLAERGMIPEARTMVRSAYEMLFYAVACLKKPAVVQQLETNDKVEREKMAREILRNAPAGHYSEEQKELIDAVLAECKTQKGDTKYTVVAAAEDADMSFMLANVYRGMSLDASHATLVSTNHFFQLNSDGDLCPVFGPNDDGIEFTLSLVATCINDGLVHFEPILMAGAQGGG